jgi:hypothetical protein
MVQSGNCLIKSAKDLDIYAEGFRDRYIEVTNYNPDNSAIERNKRVGQIRLSGNRRTQTGVGKYDK